MTKLTHARNRLHASSLARSLALASVAAFLTFGFIGCKSSSANAVNTAAVNNGTDNGTDPAEANLAPASGNTQVLAANSSYTPQQQSESYPSQPPAPVVQGYNDQDQAAEQAGEQAIDQTDQPPPPLPDYDQPPAPDNNYIWTPGYWAWGPGGYYWVPGEWTLPPYYGALWTPPYWGYNNGSYGFYPGYWGPYVGYYGGVDYGFGYIGIGYFGGYWHGNNFYYNRAVTNVGRGHYTYNHAVDYNNVRYTGRTRNRTSYNGGHGGINVRPRPSEVAAMHMTHTGALPEQRQAQDNAGRNKQQFYSANHGKPAQATSARPAAGRAIGAPPAAVRQEQQHVEQQRTAMAQHANTPQQRGAPAMEQRNTAPAAGHNNAPTAERNNMRPTNQRPDQRTAQRTAQPTDQRGAPAREQNHAAPVQRAAPQRPMENRAAPAERAQPQRQMTPRPQPQPRPQQQARPQQTYRPAPQMQSRPAQAPRTESRPAPQPRVQSRPAPQPREAPHDEHPR